MGRKERIHIYSHSTALLIVFIANIWDISSRCIFERQHFYISGRDMRFIYSYIYIEREKKRVMSFENRYHLSLLSYDAILKIRWKNRWSAKYFFIRTIFLALSFCRSRIIIYRQTFCLSIYSKFLFIFFENRSLQLASSLSRERCSCLFAIISVSYTSRKGRNSWFALVCSLVSFAWILYSMWIDT